MPVCVLDAGMRRRGHPTCHSPGSKMGIDGFVHGYNGAPPARRRSAAEPAVIPVPISPTERSEPDELGYEIGTGFTAGSSPESFKMGIAPVWGK